MNLLARFTHLFVRCAGILAAMFGLSISLPVSWLVLSDLSAGIHWGFRLLGICVVGAIDYRLILFIRDTWRPITPLVVRESSGLVAFVLFHVWLVYSRDLPVVGQQTGHFGTAGTVSAILFFCLYRTVSYWMIRSLDPNQSDPGEEVQSPAEDASALEHGEGSRYVM